MTNVAQLKLLCRTDNYLSGSEVKEEQETFLASMALRHMHVNHYIQNIAVVLGSAILLY
jgi:hypothetical protein